MRRKAPKRPQQDSNLCVGFDAVTKRRLQRLAALPSRQRSAGAEVRVAVARHLAEEEKAENLRPIDEE
jgi:ABC-type transport system involved in cytochrome c biogenesis ATPase subunit